MSERKLQQARKLIENRDYQAARKLLKKVDHPTARKWLVKLDEIAPEPKRKPFFKRVLIGAGLLLLACFGLFVCSVVAQSLNIIPDAQELAQTREVAQASTQTIVVATQNQGATATVQTNQTVIAAAATEAFNVSLTPPTATATIVPSATVTNTAMPRPTSIVTPATRVSVSLVPENREAIDALIASWSEVEGIEQVLMATVRDNIVYGELRVQVGAVTTETAETLATIARGLLMNAGLEISFILDDGRIATDFLWSNQTDTWIVTELRSIATSRP